VLVECRVLNAASASTIDFSSLAETPSTIGDLSKIPAMLGSQTYFGVHVRSSCVDNQSIGALTFEGEIDRLKFLGYQPYF